MRLKDQIKQRSGGKCELCKWKGVHMHHIFPGRKNRKISERIETVIYLCKKCHDFIHHWKGAELMKQLQVESCQKLIEIEGIEETRKILGGLYFKKESKIK